MLILQQQQLFPLNDYFEYKNTEISSFRDYRAIYGRKMHLLSLLIFLVEGQITFIKV